MPKTKIYLKTNFILHPYFFAYKEKHIAFFGENLFCFSTSVL